MSSTNQRSKSGPKKNSKNNTQPSGDGGAMASPAPTSLPTTSAPTSLPSDSSTNIKRKAVAYVQHISPVKRNKKDTLNYSSLTLQTAEGEKQALCFSKSRRDMLLERHEKKIAVEITNHTFLKDGKICINDMTEISNAKLIKSNLLSNLHMTMF